MRLSGEHFADTDNDCANDDGESAKLKSRTVTPEISKSHQQEIGDSDKNAAHDQLDKGQGCLL